MVKGKHGIPPRYLCGKTLEGSRSHITKVEDQRMTCVAARSPMGPPINLVAMTVSMSFGESVFPAGFNQKTANEDLFVKGNYGIPPHKQCGKTLENSKRQITEAEPVPLTCGAGRPHLQVGRPMGPTCQPLLATSVLHRLKDCISAVYSSRFDLRAQD